MEVNCHPAEGAAKVYWTELSPITSAYWMTWLMLRDTRKQCPLESSARAALCRFCTAPMIRHACGSCRERQRAWMTEVEDKMAILSTECRETKAANVELVKRRNAMQVCLQSSNRAWMHRMRMSTRGIILLAAKRAAEALVVIAHSSFAHWRLIVKAASS